MMIDGLCLFFGALNLTIWYYNRKNWLNLLAGLSGFGAAFL